MRFLPLAPGSLHQELVEKFGASKADADKVEKSLNKFGLKVEDVSLETRSMRVAESR